MFAGGIEPPAVPFGGERSKSAELRERSIPRSLETTEQRSSGCGRGELNPVLLRPYQSRTLPVSYARE